MSAPTLINAWRQRLTPFGLWSILLALTMLSSCGGGDTGSQALNTNGNGSGVGSGGTGSYTSGPISGLGSIIVNGVRYDVSNASVLSDDDVAGVHTAADLSLGMLVEVQGSGVTKSGTSTSPDTATALTVRYASALVGPVTAALDPGCLPSACIKVMNQTVLVSSSIEQPASVAVGDVVEVYGLIDATTGVYTATRINSLPLSTSPYKIAGTVAAVYNAGGVKTVIMGQPGATMALDFSALPSDQVPAALVSGLHGVRARVWFNAAHEVSRIRLDTPLVEDEDEARLEGLVSQLPDGDHIMRIDGAPVDVSAISATDLAGVSLGQRVRADGRLLNGTLIAIEYYAGAALTVEDTELHGPISALDTTAYTFTLRGVSVVYNPSVVHGGTLANRACVELHGRGRDANQRLIATEIEVKRCGDD